MELTAEQIQVARSLQAVDIPREISRVQGCSCGGGGGIHLVGCTIFRLPPEQVRAAEEAADRRCDEFGAALASAFHVSWGWHD